MVEIRPGVSNFFGVRGQKIKNKLFTGHTLYFIYNLSTNINTLCDCIFCNCWSLSFCKLESHTTYFHALVLPKTIDKIEKFECDGTNKRLDNNGTMAKYGLGLVYHEGKRLENAGLDTPTLLHVQDPIFQLFSLIYYTPALPKITISFIIYLYEFNLLLTESSSIRIEAILCSTSFNFSTFLFFKVFNNSSTSFKDSLMCTASTFLSAIAFSSSVTFSLQCPRAALVQTSSASRLQTHYNIYLCVALNTNSKLSRTTNNIFFNNFLVVLSNLLTINTTVDCIQFPLTCNSDNHLYGQLILNLYGLNYLEKYVHLFSLKYIPVLLHDILHNFLFKQVVAPYSCLIVLVAKHNRNIKLFILTIPPIFVLHSSSNLINASSSIPTRALLVSLGILDLLVYQILYSQLDMNLTKMAISHNSTNQRSKPTTCGKEWLAFTRIINKNIYISLLDEDIETTLPTFAHETEPPEVYQPFQASIRSTVIGR
ncbi:hypothetical protein AGLY_005401 [Aphis glycines]|uniref:Uncharacterized protein n=1 Tax=Aphis glycines TaxID=307491 RepID=A0A6G0TW74_APHGL|nr:hypothetical protein AGLY_005401 [Aphis glycines]